MVVSGGPEDATKTTEPTNEQLANFACVVMQGIDGNVHNPDFVKSIFDTVPTLREQWLENHINFQRKVNEWGEELRAQESDHI
jgi:hypothetical protein